MKLYAYYEDFGRMGSLEGLFFSDEDEIAALKEYPFWWDELLGKHSEGEFTFNNDTLSTLDVPEDVCLLLYGIFGKVISGDLDFDSFYEQIAEQKENK